MTATKRKKAAPERLNLVDQLRHEIGQSGLAIRELSRRSGVNAGIIQRFLAKDEPDEATGRNAHRDIRLATAAKLADALRLKLTDDPLAPVLAQAKRG